LATIGTLAAKLLSSPYNNFLADSDIKQAAATVAKLSLNNRWRLRVGERMLVDVSIF
jgi:hypothetical protein